MNNQQLFQALLDNPSADTLREYTRADMVILRRPDKLDEIFYTSLERVMLYPELDRLLTNGEWQSWEERRVENEKQLGRMK